MMSDYDDIKHTAQTQLEQLKAHDVDINKLTLGPKLTFNPQSESFTGAGSDKANGLLRYKMRKAFAVPEVV